MKIVSWNVNGLRSVIGYSPWCNAKKHERLQSMMEWFDSDIICLQETKINRDKLNGDICSIKGFITFYSFCNTRSGYSGVSTHIRESQTHLKPIRAQDGFTGIVKSNNAANLITTNDLLTELKSKFSEQRLKLLDNEGRCMITDHGHFLLLNVYFPNDRDGERLDFKTDYHFCIRLVVEYFVKKQQRNVILLGDINAKYQMIDSCDPGPAEDFFARESTKWFRDLVVEKDGLQMIDTFKYVHPDFSKLPTKPYTCWDTYTFARNSNYGTRIDYILVNKQLIEQQEEFKIEDANVMQSVMGSDHCPVFVQIAGIPKDFDAEKRRKMPIPKLASRFYSEFAGKQKKLTSFFMRGSSKTQKKVSANSKKRTFDEMSSSSSSAISSSSSMPTKKRQKLNEHNKNKKIKSNLLNFMKKEDNSKYIWMYSDSNGTMQSLNDNISTKLNQLNIGAVYTAFINDQKYKFNKTAEDICKQTSIAEPDKCQTVLRQSNEFQNESKENMNVDNMKNKKDSSNEMKEESAPSSKPKLSKQASAQQWKALFGAQKKSIPLCPGHNEPCILRTVTKDGVNKGKKFYACNRGKGAPNDPNAQCNFFQWLHKPTKVKNESSGKKTRSW